MTFHEIQNNGFIKLRRNLFAHYESGKISLAEFNVFVFMLMRATIDKGEIEIGPTQLHAIFKRDYDYHKCKKILASLSEKGYIQCILKAPCKGAPNVYLIDKFELYDGKSIGTRTKVKRLTKAGRIPYVAHQQPDGYPRQPMSGAVTTSESVLYEEIISGKPDGDPSDTLESPSTAASGSTYIRKKKKEKRKKKKEEEASSSTASFSEHTPEKESVESESGVTVAPAPSTPKWQSDVCMPQNPESVKIQEQRRREHEQAEVVRKNPAVRALPESQKNSPSITDGDFNPLDYAYTIREDVEEFTPKQIRKIWYFHYWFKKDKNGKPDTYWKGYVNSVEKFERSLAAMSKQIDPSWVYDGWVTSPVSEPDPTCSVCEGSGFTHEVSKAYESGEYECSVPCSCRVTIPYPWRLNPKSSPIVAARAFKA